MRELIKRIRNQIATFLNSVLKARFDTAELREVLTEALIEQQQEAVIPYGWRGYQSICSSSWRSNYRQVRENYATHASPFHEFSDFSTAIAVDSDIEVVPLRELLDSNFEGAGFQIGLRFDIDADPLTGLLQARVLSRFSLPSSFYVLHTAPYYGVFNGYGFVRSGEFDYYLDELVSSGCEVGLHTDPYTIYVEQGIDGGEAVAEELNWLQSRVGRITSTCAHNSLFRWGVASSEIFEERVLWDREVKSPIGQSLPIGVLKESDFGLEFEGSFAVPRRRRVEMPKVVAASGSGSVAAYEGDWLEGFLLNNPAHDFDERLDFQVWYFGKETWVLAGTWNSESVYLRFSGWKDLISSLKSNYRGARIMFVFHPCYSLLDEPAQERSFEMFDARSFDK